MLLFYMVSCQQLMYNPFAWEARNRGAFRRQATQKAGMRGVGEKRLIHCCLHGMKVWSRYSVVMVYAKWLWRCCEPAILQWEYERGRCPGRTGNGRMIRNIGGCILSCFLVYDGHKMCRLECERHLLELTPRQSLAGRQN